jgi:hypothetical protein
MEKPFILGVLITVLFCLTKFLEIRILKNQESKQLKEIVRDALVVLVCALTGSYIFFHLQSHITDFFNVVTETKVLNAATTQIFTDTPPF